MSNTTRCLFSAAVLIAGAVAVVEAQPPPKQAAPRLRTPAVGSDAAVKPYLSVAYRLVEAGGDKLAETLEKGQQYDVLLTLKADQREGVKINPLFRTQQAQLEIIDKRVKYAAEPRARPDKRNSKSRTVRIDPKSGSARFTIVLVEGDKLAAKDVRLKLVADLMVCEEKGTYCAKTREEALLVLPSGEESMKTLPLRFGAGDIERVVLEVGDKAPDFTATGAESKKVRLADYRGKKNVILIFGPAHW